jgi:hypothetical protein
MIDRLNKTDYFDKEWKQSNKKIKKKLKYHFWFYQNLTGFIFVLLIFIYWLMQNESIHSFLYRVNFFFQWIFQWIIQMFLR